MHVNKNIIRKKTIVSYEIVLNARTSFAVGSALTD